MLDFSLIQEIPECYDLHCKDKDHLDKIDLYAHNLLNSLSDAARETIPCSTGNVKTTYRRKCTPGWKQFVYPFQDTARFWYMVWKSAGKPVNCELHRIMKTTKNKFHYQITK